MKAAKDIAEAVEQLKGSVKAIAMVDTLEYLQRGGRIPKAAAKIGEAAVKASHLGNRKGRSFHGGAKSCFRYHHETS